MGGEERGGGGGGEMVGEVEEWVVEAMWKDGEGGEREEEVDGEK